MRNEKLLMLAAIQFSECSSHPSLYTYLCHISKVIPTRYSSRFNCLHKTKLNSLESSVQKLNECLHWCCCGFVLLLLLLLLLLKVRTLWEFQPKFEMDSELKSQTNVKVALVSATDSVSGHDTKRKSFLFFSSFVFDYSV